MHPEENIIKKIIGETPEEQYENSQKEFSLDEISSRIEKDDASFTGKKDSSINEIISRDRGEVEKVKKMFSKLFSESGEDWKKFSEGSELKKSEEQVKLIEFVNSETNKLLEKYGIEKFDVRPDKVHLFSEEDMASYFKRKFGVPIGSYLWYLQAVLLNQKEGYDKLSFSHIMYHEITHFKEYQKLHTKNSGSLGANDTEDSKTNLLIEISEDKSFFKKYDLIQQGITFTAVADPNKFKEYMFEDKKDVPNAKDFRRLLLKERRYKMFRIYFTRLKEAIVEELAVKFQKDILENNPEFEEEKKLLEEYVKQEEEKGITVDRDEVFNLRKKIRYSSDNRREYKTIEAERARYKSEREILNNLIDKLYSGNQDQFQNREEVFDLFAKSIFTGNIVGKESWGRLVEETFGKGTLKELMEKDSRLARLKDLREFVEGLKKKESGA